MNPRRLRQLVVECWALGALTLVLGALTWVLVLAGAGSTVSFLAGKPIGWTELLIPLAIIGTAGATAVAAGRLSRLVELYVSVTDAFYADVAAGRAEL